ncbi:hypothetical protein J2T17_006808 [Paenibacillus mucilaginosus]|uniref:hypothetical protein n=1 Tax=Paenibacillus mucilaginosus TaxID=61624 RepID=UPI003D25DD6D
MDSKPKKELVSKKDLVYWFIITDLVLLMSGLFTWKFKDTQDVINQVSLISSVSSILLALVAIIYAFFQTLDSKKQGDAQQRTLEKIELQINELGKIKDEFSHIKNEFISFKESSKTDKEELLLAIDQSWKSSASNVFQGLKENQIDIPQEVKDAVVESNQEFKNKYIEDLKGKLVYKSRVNGPMFDAPSIGVYKRAVAQDIFDFISFAYKDGDLVASEEIINYLMVLGNERSVAVSLAREILNELSHPQSILEPITDNAALGMKKYKKKEEYPGGPSGP